MCVVLKRVIAGLRLKTRLQDRVDVNRKREVGDVPEEWRVVTGRVGDRETRPCAGITAYMDSGGGQVGPQRTSCYDIENNMVEV